MLEMRQIESYYPEPHRAFKKNILREYLQYKILEIIYSFQCAGKVMFMGGTAIRIIHGHNRFSEDLDFDNIDITRKDFEDLTDTIQRQLILEGYRVEIKNIFKQAFHCHISILDVLYLNKISQHKEEKLVIRIDTEPQGINYEHETFILNKFDVFTRILIVPVDILLSQKILAILKRKRALGRDFIDTIYLLGRTKPNMNYLQQKGNISNVEEMKEALIARCEKINMDELAKDVEPFLIYSAELKKISLFEDYILRF
jgi:predicted nucleotidyltransferase component of viral defense system